MLWARLCGGDACPWRWRGDWAVDDPGPTASAICSSLPAASPAPSAAIWRAACSCGAAVMAPLVTSAGSIGGWPSSLSKLGGGVWGADADAVPLAVEVAAAALLLDVAAAAFRCCNCCISML
jgi:hypothetical protein